MYLPFSVIHDFADSSYEARLSLEMNIVTSHVSPGASNGVLANPFNSLSGLSRPLRGAFI